MSETNRVGPLLLKPAEPVAPPAPNEERPGPVDEREEIPELLSHYLSAAQRQSGSQK